MSLLVLPFGVGGAMGADLLQAPQPHLGPSRMSFPQSDSTARANLGAWKRDGFADLVGQGTLKLKAQRRHPAGVW